VPPVNGTRYLLTEDIGFSTTVTVNRTSATGNLLTVDSTKNLIKGQRIKLDTTIGNVVANTFYFILNITSDRTLTLSTTAVTPASTAMVQIDALKAPIDATVYNMQGATAWPAASGNDLVAFANDIVQYDSATSSWSVVFDASEFDSTVEYVTNLNTGIQYKYNGTNWVKSYEGIYIAGKWTLVL
jgi:hypothetical protein